MKVVIVELSTSHEECLYAQVLFLKHAGIKPSLLLHEALKEQVTSYMSSCEKVEFIRPRNKGALSKLRQQANTANMLKHYDLIIFNTASSGKFVRNLCLFLLGSPVRCIGVLHNGNKLLKSFTQRLISLKIKKYWVLSDQIKDHLSGATPLEVGSFYPIFFPEYKNEIQKPKDTLWVAVPGRIDWERRDYMVLIRALSKLPSQVKCKILLLGKLDTTMEGGKLLWETINESNVEKSFLLFKEFISNEEYHGYLRACDFVLPLLKSEANYLKYKISGSFNLAYAHRKPLLCKQFFETLDDLKENALFYPEDQLADILTSIYEGSVSFPMGYSNPKWSFATQQAQYITFMELKS